jgi:hypothetical protein
MPKKAPAKKKAMKYEDNSDYWSGKELKNKSKILSVSDQCI